MNTSYDYWAWDVQAIGDDAGPIPEPTEATWDTYCRRCGTPTLRTLHFCEDCVADFWAKAESYTDDTKAKDALVMEERLKWLR